MFRFISGASISDASLIKQEYCVDGQWICANISAENIPQVFRAFFAYEGNLNYCLWIETPSSLENEKIEKVATSTEVGILNTTHRDVYYMDGLSRQAAQELLAIFEEILTNDGMTNYGFISQRGNEVGKYKYNVVKAFCDGGDTTGLKSIFDELEIPEKESIKSAWDYIDSEHPGISEQYVTEDGRTVYDIIDILKDNGLYLAEQRED